MAAIGRDIPSSTREKSTLWKRMLGNDFLYRDGVTFGISRSALKFFIQNHCGLDPLAATREFTSLSTCVPTTLFNETHNRAVLNGFRSPRSLVFPLLDLPRELLLNVAKFLIDLDQAGPQKDLISFTMVSKQIRNLTEHLLFSALFWPHQNSSTWPWNVARLSGSTLFTPTPMRFVGKFHCSFLCEEEEEWRITMGEFESDLAGFVDMGLGLSLKTLNLTIEPGDHDGLVSSLKSSLVPSLAFFTRLQRFDLSWFNKAGTLLFLQNLPTETIIILSLFIRFNDEIWQAIPRLHKLQVLILYLAEFPIGSIKVTPPQLRLPIKELVILKVEFANFGLLENLLQTVRHTLETATLTSPRLIRTVAPLGREERKSDHPSCVAIDFPLLRDLELGTGSSYRHLPANFSDLAIIFSKAPVRTLKVSDQRTRSTHGFLEMMTDIRTECEGWKSLEMVCVDGWGVYEILDTWRDFDESSTQGIDFVLEKGSDS